MKKVESFLLFVFLGTIVVCYSSSVITCDRNGSCSYTGSGVNVTYICSNNGGCNCGQATTCICQDNNGDCNCGSASICSCNGNNGGCVCGSASICSCNGNNGGCCHLSDTTVLISTNNGADISSPDGSCSAIGVAGAVCLSVSIVLVIGIGISVCCCHSRKLLCFKVVTTVTIEPNTVTTKEETIQQTYITYPQNYVVPGQPQNYVVPGQPQNYIAPNQPQNYVPNQPQMYVQPQPNAYDYAAQLNQPGYDQNTINY